jgi:hypothetical protein
VVVTVALRRPSPRIAISPKKSPGHSVATSAPAEVHGRASVQEDEKRIAGRAFAFASRLDVAGSRGAKRLSRKGSSCSSVVGRRARLTR